MPKDDLTSETLQRVPTGPSNEELTVLVDMSWNEDRLGIWELVQKAPNGRGAMSVEDAAELAYKMGFLSAHSKIYGS